jgi:peptide-methionine (S)-S-oxide reductase
MFQEMLTKSGYGTITTEIVGPPAPEFYFAEDYHQQYLDKVPNGYCPNHSTGVKLPGDFKIPATSLQYVE